jgi:nitrate reductase gamma subunit
MDTIFRALSHVPKWKKWVFVLSVITIIWASAHLSANHLWGMIAVIPAAIAGIWIMTNLVMKWSRRWTARKVTKVETSRSDIDKELEDLLNGRFEP